MFNICFVPYKPRVDQMQTKRNLASWWNTVSWMVVLVMLPQGHVPPAAHAAETTDPRQAKRIVFLGDSNTFAGQYIAIVEAQLRTSQPYCPEILNLGLPSETCTGLSEPDHPFPRPDVQERAERVLRLTQPDVVVICYGMNDGIYYPFDAKRFEAYQQGMRQLVTKIKRAGAVPIVMTPPPFDPLPFRQQNKLLPKGAEKYAWFAIYENYDDVMRRYADWVKAELQPEVAMVIDLQSAVADYLAQRRRDDPDYTMSTDGVHFNNEGHQVVASAILQQWEVEPVAIPAGRLEAVMHNQTLLRDAWVFRAGHQRPGMKPGLPLDKVSRHLRAVP